MLTAAVIAQRETQHSLVLEQEKRKALRQAADLGADSAQQLCEQNRVVQGMIEYARALRFAHQAGDAELEDAIRWNLGA